MKRFIAASTIKNLNSRARSIQRRAGLCGADAVEQAAREAGLREVGRSGECVLYQNSYGARVNAWLYGTHSEDVADGGAGFDDQTELHDEESYA